MAGNQGLKAGDKAPAFSLKNTEGKTVKLSDFKGKKLALYFYPKDMTPGCTKEACGFRDFRRVAGSTQNRRQCFDQCFHVVAIWD